MSEPKTRIVPLSREHALAIENSDLKIKLAHAEGRILQLQLQHAQEKLDAQHAFQKDVYALVMESYRIPVDGRTVAVAKDYTSLEVEIRPGDVPAPAPSPLKVVEPDGERKPPRRRK